MDQNIITILQKRFNGNLHRHANILWEDVQKRLEHTEKLNILEKMESTGGEVDVVGFDSKTDEYIWMDCSTESPTGRRSLCYDQSALDGRKENKPRDSVINMATSMGVSLLTEDEYRYLQSLEVIDQKTSSWIQTPENIRKLGGAIFCDRRYDTIFVYHNGADSYYTARGWRGSVRI